ncbi:hypothetical protein IJ182_10160 [bacterium]|nr:hypothetical protein [bacterium]
MGFNVGFLSSANSNRSIIDQQALARVKEQIFNPNNDKTVDVSKLDLSKFNRVSLGTDLYAARTNGEVALQASKAATDFGVQLSNSFNANVQYLNSQAAQSLFTSKENTGKVVVNLDNTQPVMGNEAVVASSHIVEAQNMKQDKRGQNPFAFYFNAANKIDEDDGNNIFENLDELNSSIFVPSVNFLA